MKSILLVTFAGLLAVSCSDSKGAKGRVHHEPRFEDIPASWVRPANSLDMSAYWSEAAIPFGGMNYYLLPMPAPGQAWSERFNPDSKYFQAWIGIYTVEDADGAIYGVKGGELDERAVAQLGIVDQTHWLLEIGQVPSPTVALDAEYPITQEPATIDGATGWKVNCRLTTQTDTGNDNLPAGLPELLTVPKSAWEARVASYQKVSLDVNLYVWHSMENEELNVIYYNSTRFTDIDGIVVDSGPAVASELDAIAKSITVR